MYFRDVGGSHDHARRESGAEEGALPGRLEGGRIVEVDPSTWESAFFGTGLTAGMIVAPTNVFKVHTACSVPFRRLQCLGPGF